MDPEETIAVNFYSVLSHKRCGSLLSVVFLVLPWRKVAVGNK